jgi:hypothetical protein
LEPVTPDKLFARFNANPPASRDAIARCQSNLKFPLPADYVQFLERMNGGAGFVGKSYLRAWPIEDLIQFNKDYFVDVAAPELFLFGSSGGGRHSRLIPARLLRRLLLFHLLYLWKTRS